MSSNSNFNITKVTVDPVSQEITSLEINGKAVETGSEPNLQRGSLTVSENVRGILEPDEGYDGFSEVSYAINVPSELPNVLKTTLVIACDSNGNADPNAEAANAVVSYDTSSIIPLITNIWIGSSSFTKQDILGYVPSASEEYYVYQIHDEGEYPYIKEVD